MDPPNPTTGQSFSLDNYQTVLLLPADLATEAAQLSPNIAGQSALQVDASGATPPTTPLSIPFNSTIPSPVPAAGAPLSIPSAPQTVPGFSATSNAITIQEDSTMSLTLEVEGTPLTLTCTAYANNAVTPSGATSDVPTSNPIAPVIAVAGGGSTTTTTAPPAAPTTTIAPATNPSTGSGGSGGGGAGTVASSSQSLAFTGPGSGVTALGILGAFLILSGFALLILMDAPRRAIAGLAVVGHNRWKSAVRHRLPDTTSRLTDSTLGALRRGGAKMSVARMPDKGRELAQSTTRVAQRTATWLLGR
jgi:hypothetical protein